MYFAFTVRYRDSPFLISIRQMGHKYSDGRMGQGSFPATRCIALSCVYFLYITQHFTIIENIFKNNFYYIDFFCAVFRRMKTFARTCLYSTQFSEFIMRPCK